MLYYLFILFYIIVCVVLVLIILIQNNKGMGLSGAFGAVGAGENFLSSTGAFNILVKITTVLALIFALSSFGLSYFPPPSAQGTGSIMEEEVAIPQTVSEMIQQQEAAQPQTGTQPVEQPAEEPQP